MNKAKRKSTSLAVAIMILALCVIVGTTFALWRYNVEGFSAVNFGKVEIAGNESIDRTIQLKDAVPGDVLFTDLSFSKSADSESMYVRAHIEYTTPSTVPVIVDMVEDLNTNFAFDLNTATNTCQWSENYGNYFYLLDSTGNALYNIEDNTEIIISDEFRLPLMIEQPEDLSQYMEIVNLEIHLQAIQSLGISSDVIVADKVFAELFGEGAKLPPYTIGQFTSGEFNGAYYIEMGSYPQTKLTDANIKAIFDAGNGLIAGETYILEDATGVSAECLVYQYGNDKYVKFEMTEANSCSLDFPYFTRFHGVQYYKIEPVRWIVIGDGNGNELSQDFDMYTTSLDSVTVVSEKILIQHMFNPREVHQTSTGAITSNDWENSAVRTFMNNALLNDLFTQNEIDWIQDTDLTTSYYNYNTSSADLLVTLSDKLFSLSLDEQNSVEYDDTFTIDLILSVLQYPSISSGLRTVATDLAIATGTTADPFESYADWSLRCGSVSTWDSVCTISDDEFFSEISRAFVHSSWDGLRPAFVLSL